MCGRLVIYSPPERYAELFGITSSCEMNPSYNIPPTSSIPACRVNSKGERELSLMRWGLVPRWSKGPDSRYSMFNARAETVHEKPAYRTAFKKQRCLIPVDGFYEWTQNNGKQPYFIHRNNNDPLVLAGLWDHWQENKTDAIDSCTIIVTGANALMRSIHDRMPVILEPSQYDAWLDPTTQDSDDLRDMLKPYQPSDLESYAVSRDVNSPKNDRPGLINKME
ncbi:MAG: SOS response-associated peptidase [Gammaproteobacteria bacterium]|jgi:putative SOS response-associated peptidase YedK